MPTTDVINGNHHKKQKERTKATPKSRTNKGVKHRPYERSTRKPGSVKTKTTACQPDSIFPTLLDKVSSIFSHIQLDTGAISHLIIFHKAHKLRLNAKHIGLLKEASKKMCMKYLKEIRPIRTEESIEISDHHTFTIASTTPKPRSYPDDMKTVVVTKWTNQQYYLVSQEKGSRQVWLARSNIKNKTALKTYHRRFTRQRYTNSLPKTFDNDNAGWGDPLHPKHPDTIRISMENIRSIGVSNKKNIKQEKLKEWLACNDVDIACWQELGVNWRKCCKQDRLPAHLSCVTWEKMQMSTAYNKHDNHLQGQYGGTAVIALGHITGTIDETAVDQTGLGRWASIKLLGRGGKKTRIVSAYNPCKPSGHKFKDNTVYAQHRRYFLQHSITTCPRERFK